MNKLSLLLIASALALPVAACNGSGSNDDGADSSVVTTSATGDDGIDGGGSADDGSGSSSTAGSDGAATGDSSGGDGGNDQQCIHKCTIDEDCLSGGMGILTCDPTIGRCIIACAADIDCFAIFSSWTAMACTTNDECTGGPCVDYAGDGNGGCALDSTMNDCATTMQEEIDAVDVDGNPVTVCATTSTTCQDQHGAMACVPVDSGTPPTCDELACQDPLTCDDTNPACNCMTAADCGQAGVTFPFDGGTIECGT